MLNLVLRYWIAMKHLCCLVLAVLLVLDVPTTSKAQDVGSQAGQLWKTASTNFAAGNYPAAAENFQAIINLSATVSAWMNSEVVIPPAPQNRLWLDPVFYMLGAAQFNAKNWPEAIRTFRAYRQLFPKSTRLAQASFSLGQADLLGGHPDDAIPILTTLLPFTDYHTKSLLLLVQADEAVGRGDDAVALLEKEKTMPNVDPAVLGKLDMRLALLCFAHKDLGKVESLLVEIDGDIVHVPDIVQFNTLATKEADQLLLKNQVDDALRCYRMVRSNEQINDLQKEQIALLQQQQTANLVRIRADPLNTSQLQFENQEIAAQIVKDQDVSAKYQTLPAILPPLYLRIGRAYAIEGKFWEAVVIYREIMRRYPTCAEFEGAVYGSIVAFDRVKQSDEALALCASYLQQFPQGKYIDSVRFLRGAVAYDAEDFDNATTYFNGCLTGSASNPQRPQIELTLGDIKLRQGKYDDAVLAYQRYEKDFPANPDDTPGQLNFQRVQYRIALALVLGGKYDQAKTALADYLQKYPTGAYVADVEYRQDVIKFAESQYDQVIADGVAWQARHGTSGPLAEVLALIGDAYASQDKDDEAIAAYQSSFKAALAPDVLNYSIFAAAKLMQKHAQWAAIVQMFQQFIKDNPDHPTAVTAIVWIGRAEIKQGRVEEAKQYMADTAKQYLNDPSREAVDEIITQLAQLYARRHLQLSPAPSVPTAPQTIVTGSTPGTPIIASAAQPVTQQAGTAATSTVSSTVSPVPQDPALALEQILTIPDINTQPTAQTRILFAKSELARLMKQLPVSKQLLLQIGAQFKPEVLSPIILGKVGDSLVEDGKNDQAMPFYNQLMDEYDKSAVVDYAYGGLGQIAYDEQDYAKADRYFSKALDKGLAEMKLKEITLGEAQTLLKLNRPLEAKPLFEQVASTRAWRGEATALSVFSLGQIQMQLGKFAEANAYYQRVFVAYQKYPDVQAKAYLGSGQAFEKLGMTSDAINTYSEMLKNPNLASFAEYSEAKQRLDQLPH